MSTSGGLELLFIPEKGQELVNYEFCRKRSGFSCTSDPTLPIN